MAKTAKRVFKVRLPNGKSRSIHYFGGADRNRIVETLLEEWSELCEENWLNSNHKDKGNAEGLVKHFMADLSEFLIAGDEESKSGEHPVMTQWAHRRAKMSEVLTPGDPRDQEEGIQGVSDEDLTLIQETARPAFTGKKYKTKKMLSQPWVGKFNRLMRYRYKDPDCQVESFPIDTENVFTAYGVTYRMDESVQQYAPRMGRGGEPVYDMDRVLVAKMTDGALHFMDLNAWEIPAEMISTV